MAGQTRSRTTRSHGRPARGDRSRAVAVPAASAARTTTAAPTDVPTRSTYRMLVMRGLAPDEAANLTAFLSGLHVGDQRWDLKELNKLLFLRDMQRSGRFGETDGNAQAS